MSSDLEKIVTRLESVATRLENLPQLTETGDMKPVLNTNNLVVAEYEKLLNGELQSFLQISNKIGGDVQTQGALIQKAFAAQLEYLKTATTSSKPSDSALQTLLKPMSDAIANITNFRETNRHSEYFNHLSAISEGIAVLGWVGVSPAPCPYIKEMQDSSQFYTNRVIKDFKEKNIIHVDWTKAWMAIFVALQAFVKKHYTTGLTWAAKAAQPSTCFPTTCFPTPPPPPPPMAPKPSANNSADSHAKLFSEINKGTDVTGGLKKVTDDMKTHKNPNLRAGSTVPAKSKLDSAPIPTKLEITKIPEMKLDGNKWTVQHFRNKKDIVLSETALRHTLYIFKCENSVITVKGKINSIVMDNCTKTALVFDGLISALDIVNCKSVQAQTLGVLPTVNIDKTDGAQIFLSKESIGAEIISAKSSEMNVLIPKDDGEMTELALPEQYKTKIVNGKLVTTCAEDF